jgi:hypothetical protein
MSTGAQGIDRERFKRHIKIGTWLWIGIGICVGSYLGWRESGSLGNTLMGAGIGGFANIISAAFIAIVCPEVVIYTYRAIIA